MDMGTKALSKSCLALSHFDESRDASHVSSPMLPKGDDLRQIISLDSAEMMDLVVAEPLLHRNVPETEMTAEKLLLMAPTMVERTMSVHQPTLLLSLKDFPSLERGRTSKLRENFEIGATRHRPEGAWPKGRGGDQVSRPVMTTKNQDVVMESPSQPESDVEGIRSLISRRSAQDPIELNQGNLIHDKAEKTGDASAIPPKVPISVGNMETNKTQPTPGKQWRTWFERIQVLTAHKSSSRRTSRALGSHRPPMASRPSTSPGWKSRNW